jgi:hypothetical protein
MIELATGVAFLMSSLYGAGQAQSLNTPDTTVPTQGTTTQDTATTTPITQNQIEAYLSLQYADEPILVDIARCESTFRQFDLDGQVMRGKVDHSDVGVMQINEVYNGPEALKMGYDIYTLEGNVAFAKYLYAKLGTQPWASSEGCWGAGNDLARK